MQNNEYDDVSRIFCSGAKLAGREKSPEKKDARKPTSAPLMQRVAGRQSGWRMGRRRQGAQHVVLGGGRRVGLGGSGGAGCFVWFLPHGRLKGLHNDGLRGTDLAAAERTALRAREEEFQSAGS